MNKTSDDYIYEVMTAKNGNTHKTHIDEDILYIDNHGDVCLSKQEDITICCGSQHKITINKLFGPTGVKNLKIVWEGNNWNISNRIEFLRKENKRLKLQAELYEKKINDAFEKLKALSPYMDYVDMNEKTYLEEINKIREEMK